MDRSRQGDDSASDSNSEASVSLDVLPLHSTHLLTVLSANGTVQYESPAIERIYGFEQDELVGEQVADYCHPEDREAVTDAFQAVVAGDRETVEAIEYRHEQADGTYCWVESVASGHPTPDGHYVVNTRDISERKQRDHRLQQTNDRLEEFAGIVSHDLRNPLSVAQGRLELAQEDCESEHLESVATALDRMDSLLEGVLALSRVGQQISEQEPVTLRTVSETCWETVPTADATLELETDRRVLADRSRLRQLLANLFRNAVEHGGESVTVTVGDFPDGFYVEDDGTGIPEAHRSAVFEVGTSAAPDGTGLGLSIVEQIVAAHGWEIDVMAGGKGGARFEISGVQSNTD